MRSRHDTLSIAQMLALMLSARLYPTSNSTNSVVITEIPRVLSSSWLPIPLQWFMNETTRLLRHPQLSVACNLPWSYHPVTWCTIVLIPDSALIPGMGAYLLLANAPR